MWPAENMIQNTVSLKDDFKWSSVKVKGGGAVNTRGVKVIAHWGLKSQSAVSEKQISFRSSLSAFFLHISFLILSKIHHFPFFLSFFSSFPSVLPSVLFILPFTSILLNTVFPSSFPCFLQFVFPRSLFTTLPLLFSFLHRHHFPFPLTFCISVSFLYLLYILVSFSLVLFSLYLFLFLSSFHLILKNTFSVLFCPFSLSCPYKLFNFPLPFYFPYFSVLPHFPSLCSYHFPVSFSLCPHSFFQVYFLISFLYFCLSFPRLFLI